VEIMLNCRQASELMSQGMDGKLSLKDRWALKVHLMMCRGCASFMHQIRFLRKAGNRWQQHSPSNPTRLSNEAKKRINDALDDFKNGRRLHNDDKGTSS